MTDNCLVISGCVYKAPTRVTSPAGVPHCYFTLEHSSKQMEAGLPRNVYCRIRVVVSGEQSQHLTQGLTRGSHIRATGFIIRQEDKNGIGHLVLHAHSIETI